MNNPEVAPLELKKIFNKERSEPKWRKILVESEVPDGLEPLIKISKNLWWAWHEEAEALFESIDPELWRSYKKNPVALLDVLPYAKLKRLEKNTSFMDKLQDLYRQFEYYVNTPKSADQPKIAYFCMEYGLHQVIRLYSGGLGILAGDHLKEASDSNLDLVGIGLLYRYGYFNQSLSLHGDQQEEYKPQKFTYLPIVPVRDEKGDWVQISIEFPGREVLAKIWKIDVGRVTLYLLDTDIEENSAEDRAITYQLYGGDHEHRLKQEILLGIGGIHLLKKLGIQPDVYHCNEGHAAFMGLERIKQQMKAENISFYEALDIVRTSTLFTTHTPVPAGHDVFSEELIRTYFSNFAQYYDINWSSFVGLGRKDETDAHEKFSMSNLAARISQEINGVSKIHGEVSRHMFNDLWPGFTADELHISYVTNGVHYPTWAASEWKQFYREHFEENFLDNAESWKKIYEVADEEVWSIRQKLKNKLIEALKEKIRTDLTHRSENPKKVLGILNALNDKALIIGFARRFATYKRAFLLFHNLERLEEIVNQSERPVILLFAGKAHPKDKGGQELIRQILEVSKMPQFLGKIVFLENYEMNLASYLVSGVDVWLNNPERPMEASGTSGMKAALNGVLNLSVLDGWWAEGYKPSGGWALPEKNTYEAKDFQNELDAETIYRIIDNEIIPSFFERNDKDIPVQWVKKVKSCIAEIAPHFTTRRMINDYYKKYYSPLYEKIKALKADNYTALKALNKWKTKVMHNWPHIQVVDMNLHDSAHQALPLGEDFVAEIILNLGELTPADIGVEVVFNQKHDHEEQRQLIFQEELAAKENSNNHTVYYCNFPVTQSGVFEYGFRIFPKNNLLTNRMDFNLIKWV